MGVVINMKKNMKRDIFNILVLIISFFIVFFVVTNNEFMFGSFKDWNQQHWIIPEYFRNLFYETHDLFPDLAFNLGNGQNIYNLSYYGFLSPVIFISYLFPFVAMNDYIIISTIVLLLTSSILMYFFMKKKTNDYNIALIGSFIFLMASPLIFHAHRHIMFMNYLPFLLMGYFGVDKYFEKNSKWLLTLSVFLMIMTSYLFSVCGILSIVIYGIYCYLQRNDKITLKDFISDGFKFVLPILVGVLMSCILIGPTFYSLLNGRESTTSMNLFKLLMPDIDISKLLYGTYAMGLSSLALIGLVGSFSIKKKENIFLATALAIILIFPIFTYLLNGGLYTESKILIPLIPLFILMIGDVLKNIFEKRIKVRPIIMSTVIICSISLLFNDYKQIEVLLIELSIVIICVYLLYKKKYFRYFYMYLFPALLIINICFNFGDTLIEKDYYDRFMDPVLNVIDDDQSFYRVNVFDYNLDHVNRVYDSEYYTSGMYSSSASIGYEDFFYQRIGNEITFRTYRQMGNTANLFYNIYNGNKYLVADDFDSGFYKKIGDMTYINDNVLPVGYVSNRLMSRSYYDELNYPDNIYAYLNYVIVDDDHISNHYDSKFEKIDLDYDLISTEAKYEFIDNGIKFNSSKNKSKVKLHLNNDLENKVLLVSFDMKYQEMCDVGDTYIKINGIENKLSCRSWKYNNKNYNFIYVLSSNDLSDIDIEISKGDYTIKNLNFYTIDYDDVRDVLKVIDPLVIDREKTLGDKIVGTINVTEDGYFNLSVPYDEGFKIYVDGKMVDYEKTDINFMGFMMKKGHHDVEIIYEAPYKKVSMWVSIIGFILFILEVLMVGFINVFGDLLNEIKNPKTKLFKLIMGLYSKYKEIVNYLIVGVLTTVVSLASKWILLFTVLDAENAFQLQVAIIISWICAVLFAYVTNRMFVFFSKNKNILQEMAKFFGARILTLLMEMVIMWFFVTLLRMNSDTWVLIWTVVTQVLIMVFNYVFSKLLVFKKK